MDEKSAIGLPAPVMPKPPAAVVAYAKSADHPYPIGAPTMGLFTSELYSEKQWYRLSR